MLDRIQANRYEINALVPSKLIHRLEEHPLYMCSLEDTIFLGYKDTITFYDWMKSHARTRYSKEKISLVRVKFNRRSAEVCSSILYSLEFEAERADKFVTLLKAFELDYLNRSSLRHIAFSQMIKKGEL